MIRMINNKGIYRRNDTRVFEFVFTTNREHDNKINSTNLNTLFRFVFENFINFLIARGYGFKTKPNTCSSSFSDIPLKKRIVFTYTPPLRGGVCTSSFGLVPVVRKNQCTHRIGQING